MLFSDLPHTMQVMHKSFGCFCGCHIIYNFPDDPRRTLKINVFTGELINGVGNRYQGPYEWKNMPLGMQLMSQERRYQVEYMTISYVAIDCDNIRFECKVNDEVMCVYFLPHPDGPVPPDTCALIGDDKWI